MNAVVAVVIVWWLAVVVLQRREKARNEARDYQMSEGWVARWHHTHHGPFPAA